MDDTVNPQGTDLESAATRIGGLMGEPLLPTPSGDPTSKANLETTPETDDGNSDEAKPATAPEDAPSEDPHPESAEGEEPKEAPDEDASSDEEPPEPTEEDWQLPETLAALAEDMGLEEEEVLSTLRVPIKVNGETTEVTLADLRDGHQMEKDYREKTSALAKDRQEFEAASVQATQATQQWLSDVTDQLKAAETLFEGQVEAINLDQLFQMDPEYGRGVEKAIQATRKQFEEQRQALAVRAQQHAAYVEANAATHKQQEVQKLAAVWPEFVDPVKGGEVRQGFQNKMQSYYGITRADLDQIGDHRAFSVMKDAIAFRELQAARPETRKKLKGKPKFLKAGTPKSKGQSQRDQSAAAISSHRKAQNVDSAAAALKRGGFA